MKIDFWMMITIVLAVVVATILIKKVVDPALNKLEGDADFLEFQNS